MQSLVFWYNAPTVHQFGLIRALASQGLGDVTLVTFTGLLTRRRQMGWTEPDYGRARRIVEATPSQVDQLLREHDDPTALHIFSGVRSFAPVYGAFRRAIRTRGRIGVTAVMPDPRGWAGRLRHLAYATDALRFGRRIDLMLALGESGADWYERIGYAHNKVFPFGNFSADVRVAAANANSSGPFNILYIGELIELKRVDVLLDALVPLKSRSWTLRVVGGGPLEAELHARAHSQGLVGIEWLGFRDRAAVQAELASADCLVLPSAHDGWGSVANEALLAGVPVVCTDACGVACAVRLSGEGAVVKANDPEALTDVLRKLVDDGPIQLDRRERLKRWASCLLPESGARYLRDLVSHRFAGSARPLPPWAEATSPPR